MCAVCNLRSCFWTRKNCWLLIRSSINSRTGCFLCLVIYLVKLSFSNEFKHLGNPLKSDIVMLKGDFARNLKWPSRFLDWHVPFSTVPWTLFLYYSGSSLLQILNFRITHFFIFLIVIFRWKFIGYRCKSDIEDYK